MNQLKRKDYKRLSQTEIDEVLILRQNGSSVSSIANKFNSSERQIHRIVKAAATGQLNRKENSNKNEDILQKLNQSVLQEHHFAWISEELKSDPGITLECISERLQEEFGISISVSTIWRYQKNGFFEKFENILKNQSVTDLTVFDNNNIIQN